MPDDTKAESREIKHEAVVLSIKADAPRVRVKPKPDPNKSITLSPPSADMGVKPGN